MNPRASLPYRRGGTFLNCPCRGQGFRDKLTETGTPAQIVVLKHQLTQNKTINQDSFWRSDWWVLPGLGQGEGRTSLEWPLRLDGSEVTQAFQSHVHDLKAPSKRPPLATREGL